MTGLEIGTEYDMEVRAVSSVGRRPLVSYAHGDDGALRRCHAQRPLPLPGLRVSAENTGGTGSYTLGGPDADLFDLDTTTGVAPHRFAAPS